MKNKNKNKIRVKVPYNHNFVKSYLFIKCQFKQIKLFFFHEIKSITTDAIYFYEIDFYIHIVETQNDILWNKTQEDLC